MNQSPLAPMGVGKLLDRSFTVYRQHFGAFFLLALMLFGPFLLLQDLLVFDIGNLSFFMQDTDGSDFWESVASRFAGMDTEPTDKIGFLLLYLLVVLPVMGLGAYPQLVSSTLLMTRAAVEGQTLGIKAALKQSMGRFWPLVGATVVYSLVIVGIVLAFVLLFGLLALIVTLISGESLGSIFDGDDAVVSALFIMLFIVAYLIFIVLIMLVPGFFMLRWGFYLPYVLLEGGGVPLGKSWNLTKGNFWRLFGLYVVLVVLYSVFSGGVQVAVYGLLGASILSQLLMLLFSCVLMPWMMIVYSLAYLDLRVRKDGTDLMAMLEKQAGHETATPHVEEGPGVSHE
ncbi:ABC transporter ATP-binding protein [Brevibacillus brevis]|uniref:ABC transporter ATP-binding protein n=1 Tax=Brevibacillus brevis TaxID=1393 RepID=A0ABY9SXW4_BREBE|nr:ABC transporter ATP-binding protein [Brevibacillus brevis]WNC12654.1 ABC transporter ATP-binding protein [Brevibacillus brevis]